MLCDGDMLRCQYCEHLVEFIKKTPPPSPVLKVSIGNVVEITADHVTRKYNSYDDARQMRKYIILVLLPYRFVAVFSWILCQMAVSVNIQMHKKFK
jgi:hypothetical protein